MLYIENVMQEISRIQEAIDKFQIAKKSELKECDKKYHKLIESVEEDIRTKESKIQDLNLQISKLKKDLVTIYTLLGVIEYQNSLKANLSEFDINSSILDMQLQRVCKENSYSCGSFQLEDLRKSFDLKVVQIDNNQAQIASLKQALANLNTQKELLLQSKEDEISSIRKKEELFKERMDSLISRLSNFGTRTSSTTLGKDVICSLSDYHVSDTGIFPDKIQICKGMLSNNDFPMPVFSENLSCLDIPFYLDLKNNGSSLIDTEQDVPLDIVEKYIISILLSFLSSIPTNNISFGFYSPFCNSMSHVNAFINACLKNGLSIQQEMFQSRNKFSTLLSLIHQRADNISEKLFANKCNDFIELCAKGASLDKAQIIVMHNFLSDITDEELRELLSCVKGYQRCGVYFVLIDTISSFTLENRSKRFLSYVNELTQACDTFVLDEECFKYVVNPELNDDDAQDIAIYGATFVLMYIKDALENTTPQMLYDFCMDVSNIKEKNKNIISFDQIHFYENHATCDYDRITIPVGVNYPTVWEMEFGSVGNSPIANFIVGEPGTGKSQLINTIILSGAKKYSPDELIFHLIDFKNNSDLNAFMTTTKIPHVKAILTSVKEEDSTIILSNLLIECENRIEQFKELSDQLQKPIRNIGEYNRGIDENHLNLPHMPKLIIIIDECQHLFVSDALSEMCERIVREGRSQGVHLILSTQVVERKMLKTLRLISGIYCFALGSGVNDTSELFENKKYLSTMSTDIPKGSYMCYASNNHGKDCATVKIAYADKKEVQYASEICTEWHQYPIDFAKIGDQSPLQYSPNDSFPTISKNTKDIYPLTMGINYMNDHPVILNFKREYNASLFMLGNNSEGVYGVFNTLCMQTKNCTTYVIDASKELKLLHQLERNPQSFKMGNETSFIEFLNELWKTYEERRKDIRGDYDPVFFFINEISNIDDFMNNVPLAQQEEQADDDDLASLFKRRRQDSSERLLAKECLFKLLKEASRYNIFLCLSATNLSFVNDDAQYSNLSISAQYDILKKSCYIGVFNDASDVERITNFTFKTSTLNSINENMMILITRQNTVMKLKYYHFDGESL